MRSIRLKIFRGTSNSGEFKEYTLEVEEGMVVLDAIHRLQATQSPDLACRWNCKAGKCGSCSAEINGKPRLMCMTRLNDLPVNKTITIAPLQTFPIMKDLATDVSWNYQVNKKITPFTPKSNAEWHWEQKDIDRIQEFRKCIECFLCQDVCHVLRVHQKHSVYAGPRFFVRMAALEMHPIDSADRLPFLKTDAGLGYCNITKCCTQVCPESIAITDNAIIPLKERVVDRFYDPIFILFRKLFKKK
jgi:succinate dehydrogenase / fumarate reductase iron-sulfur subunit